MAYGGRYAMSAFEESIDAYLELPFTVEKLDGVRIRLEQLK